MLYKRLQYKHIGLFAMGIFIFINIHVYIIFFLYKFLLNLYFSLYFSFSFFMIVCPSDFMSKLLIFFYHLTTGIFHANSTKSRDHYTSSEGYLITIVALKTHSPLLKTKISAGFYENLQKGVWWRFRDRDRGPHLICSSS